MKLLRQQTLVDLQSPSGWSAIFKGIVHLASFYCYIYKCLSLYFIFLNSPLFFWCYCCSLFFFVVVDISNRIHLVWSLPFLSLLFFVIFLCSHYIYLNESKSYQKKIPQGPRSFSFAWFRIFFVLFIHMDYVNEQCYVQMKVKRSILPNR